MKSALGEFPEAKGGLRGPLLSKHVDCVASKNMKEF